MTTGLEAQENWELGRKNTASKKMKNGSSNSKPHLKANCTIQ
jgi:hypothetical protein